jgi:threonine dehydrogenase-like Zn-dependent dehydrogenase
VAERKVLRKTGYRRGWAKGDHAFTVSALVFCGIHEGRTMRALVYRGPGDIGVEDRPDPQPGRDEVLLRITATGICGSDLHGYTGENKRRHPGQVMGHETVGRIATVGAYVSDETLQPGRVATVNPVIGCGECVHCAAGSLSSCAHGDA